MSSSVRTALNLAVFYAGWVATVVSAAHGWRAAAIAAALAVVALHVMVTPNRRGELRLVAFAGFVGAVAETIILQLGLARYAAPDFSEQLPPAWLIAIWMAFATTLNASLAWLRPRPGLAAVLGAVFAPLSYYAGARLGGMALAAPEAVSLAGIGLVWLVAFPVLLRAAVRFDAK